MTKRFAFIDQQENGSIDYTSNGGQTTHFFGPMARILGALIRLVCSTKGGPYADGEVGVCPGREGGSMTIVWKEGEDD